jgi:uncharacterized repeat protein (TIGR03803 family)
LSLSAQFFTSLYAFDGGSDGSSEDPNSLILAGGILYGTTGCCSSFLDPRNNGTVFAINADGTGFTTVYEFTGGSDGGDPWGTLAFSAGRLYGTTQSGGTLGLGTVFAVNTDGTGFTTLYAFSGGSDGANPVAGLTLSDDKLYGTTANGGSSGQGAVFALRTDGAGFTNLHSFTGGADGSHPGSRTGNHLALSGSTLYGTSSGGGSSGRGTVFAVNTDGTGFTNLHSFTGGAEGTNPVAVILSGNSLYGTTSGGGSSHNGTVFKLNIDGTGYRILHNFGGYDGAMPNTPLAGISGTTLYGTTRFGVDSSGGTVFQIGTDGTGFTTLYQFSGVPGSPPYINGDGDIPASNVVLSGNTLYGTTAAGGSSGLGTLFSISLPASPPQLTITLAAGNVVLTWPTNATGFILQSTPNVGSGTVWSTNLAAPVVVDGRNTVTNTISGALQIFRLSQ